MKTIKLQSLKLFLFASLVMAGGLLLPTAANATPYVLKLVQQGNNVVATGSGEFDLSSGVGFVGNAIAPAVMVPSSAELVIDTNPAFLDQYDGFFTGPASFGNPVVSILNSWSGNAVGVNGGGVLWVPTGYVSETPLTTGAIWDNATFASLGVTPGTYTWTWGTGADQSFTLMVLTSVPEPAELGMFGVGLLLIGVFASRRRHAR